MVRLLVRPAVAPTPQRSELMRRVRRKNTTAELKVRSALRHIGIIHSVHGRGLPGTPDILNRKDRWVIMVHGCFWHRHAGCKRATLPKKNRQFWKAKFDSNLERDERKQKELKS